MKKTNKILLIIIVIVAVLAVLVTGLFLLLPKEEVQQGEEIREESNEKEIVVESVKEKEVVGEGNREININTGTWLTYRNESFNYKIKYPINWNIDEVRNNISSQILFGSGIPPFASISGPPKGIIVNVGVYKPQKLLNNIDDYINKNSSLNILSREDVKVNDFIAVRLKGEDKYGYYILKNNMIYKFYIWQWSKDKQSDKEMLDVIVNNFSFIK